MWIEHLSMQSLDTSQLISDSTSLHSHSCLYLMTTLS
jgi:hypothetical protein